MERASQLSAPCGAKLLAKRFGGADLDARVNVADGVCHGDLHLIDNDLGISNYPPVPGHEIVGTITAMSERAEGLTKSTASAATRRSKSISVEEFSPAATGIALDFRSWARTLYFSAMIEAPENARKLSWDGNSKALSRSSCG